MNWGEIQIESLKKMFLNTEELKIDDLESYKGNKKYKTYLFAMPQACNEAIRYICNELGSKESIYELELEGKPEIYDLSELIEDYRKLVNVISLNNVKWSQITNDLLRIDTSVPEEVKVLYQTKTNVISANTEAEETTGLEDEHSTLIPLYVAAELYKDDDLSLSTMYMNEFLSMIASFKDSQRYISNPKITTIYSIN